MLAEPFHVKLGAFLAEVAPGQDLPDSPEPDPADEVGPPFHAPDELPPTLEEPPPAARGGKLHFPAWDHDRSKPVPDHVKNTEALCRYYGVQVRYNLMTHDLEVAVPGRQLAMERRANCTVDWVENRAAEHQLSRSPVLKHLQELASEFHPVLNWVLGTPWDGRDRLPQLLDSVSLASHADPDLCGLLIRRWLCGAAASLLPEFEERFAAQGVLVAQGPQGRGKSRWLQSLVPHPSWVLTGETIDPSSRDSTQRATSVWLCELGEVDATFKRSDIAALKAFVTRPDDVYRSAYARRPERVLRRTVFFASVNDEQYLVDRTGNRRWWTVAVDRCRPDHGTDMQQLWAQLVHEVRSGGIWWLAEDELNLLNQSNRTHEQEDVLTSLLEEYWVPIAENDVFGPSYWRTLAQVCGELPQFKQRLPTPAEQRRVTDALREMGTVKKRDKHGVRYLLRRVA